MFLFFLMHRLQHFSSLYLVILDYGYNVLKLNIFERCYFSNGVFLASPWKQLHRFGFFCVDFLDYCNPVELCNCHIHLPILCCQPVFRTVVTKPHFHMKNFYNANPKMFNRLWISGLQIFRYVDLRTWQHEFFHWSQQMRKGKLFLVSVLELVPWDLFSTIFWGEVVGRFVRIYFDEKRIEEKKSDRSWCEIEG